MIAVIIGEASHVKDILRYMEIMQHEIVIGKKMNYNKCLGNDYSSIGHKLAKDIIYFYLKVNDIKSDFFDDIFNE